MVSVFHNQLLFLSNCIGKHFHKCAFKNHHTVCTPCNNFLHLLKFYYLWMYIQDTGHNSYIAIYFTEALPVHVADVIFYS